MVSQGLPPGTATMPPQMPAQMPHSQSLSYREGPPAGALSLTLMVKRWGTGYARMRASGADGERQAEEVGFLAFITPSTPKNPIRINITALFWNRAARELGHCMWLGPEPSVTDSRRRLQPQKSCRSICRDFPGFYWLIWPCGSPLRLLACRQRFARGVRYWCRRLSNVRRQSQRSKNTQAIQSSSYGYNPHRFYRIQCAVFLTEMPPNLSVWWSVKPWKPSGSLHKWPSHGPNCRSERWFSCDCRYRCNHE